MASIARYRPVFAGRSQGGEEIKLYVSADDAEYADFPLRRSVPTIIHIQVGDGELWALNPGDEVEYIDLPTDERKVTIVSKIWSGVAYGNEADLIRAPVLRG